MSWPDYDNRPDRPHPHRSTASGEFAVSRKKKKSHPRKPSHSERSFRVVPLDDFEFEKHCEAESFAEYHVLFDKLWSFPFSGMFVRPLENGRFEVAPVAVVRLMPLEEDDPEEGIQVEAIFAEGNQIVPLYNIRRGAIDGNDDPLLEAYCEWYDERLEGSEIKQTAGPFEADGTFDLKGLSIHIVRAFVYGAGAGGATGGIFMAVPRADTGGTIGAVAFGLFGIAFFLYAVLQGASARTKILGLVLFALLGAFVGGTFGLSIGILLVAYMGTIPGGLAGWAIGRWLLRTPVKVSGMWAIAGSLFGGLVYAYAINADAVRSGFGIGLLLGIAILILMAGLFVVSSMAVLWPKSE